MPLSESAAPEVNVDQLIAKISELDTGHSAGTAATNQASIPKPVLSFMKLLPPPSCCQELVDVDQLMTLISELDTDHLNEQLQKDGPTTLKESCGADGPTPTTL